MIKSSAAHSNLLTLCLPKCRSISSKHKTAALCWLGVSDTPNLFNKVQVKSPFMKTDANLHWYPDCKPQQSETRSGLLFADLDPDPASSLCSSHSCESSKTHLHFLKSEFVSTGLTHFPVEIFLFVQQLLRAVVMLMNAGIFLKHAASYRPPQL